MTMDDGCGPDMTSDDDFRAKFCALCETRRLSFGQLCAQAGVDQGAATEAIARGTYGLPASQSILVPLLNVFGLDLSWLLAGHSAPAPRQLGRRFELFELVYQFALRNEIPKSHRRVLIAHAMEKLDSQPTHSLKMAARVGIPRTMADIAYLYQRLCDEGAFE